ncbi:MAG: NAD-dependent epimerase/dehydratase family protein, partial [Bacteroidota bacterium]
ESFYLQVAGGKIHGEWELALDSEILVLNIPPRRRKDPNEAEDYYHLRIKRLLNVLAHTPIKHILFISSTSVYGSISGVVTEETEGQPPFTASAMSLMAVEQDLILSRFRTTILRLGGLIGPGRHPVKFLAGRRSLTGGGEPVNLVHLTDCIELIYRVIKHDAWGQIFHASAAAHPLKSEYYPAVARNRGLVPPDYQESDSEQQGKIIDSTFTREYLDYQFKYDDPFEMEAISS